LIEPILLNDENVIRGLNNNLVETLCEILIFQSNNIQNIFENREGVEGAEIAMPTYLKILIRCLTSMMRTETTVEKLVNVNNCRALIALVKIMKYSKEEELVANSLKIIRYSLREEPHQQRAIVEYPELINEVIQHVFKNFVHSTFINGEMKNILGLFTRKKEYVYLIKPDSIVVLVNHPSDLVSSFPTLEQISKSYIIKNVLSTTTF